MDSNGSRRRWAVVLAGGEGARMRDFITAWLGEHRPKQYCSFVGERTMLEHTLDRARDAAPEERIVTVIGRGHGLFLDSPRPLRLPGRVIEQPENRDTAPGLLLALAHVLADDPDALVAVLPSDHFIHPRHRFAAGLDRALSLADRLAHRIVLLAAPATHAETDYGWIEPGELVTAAAFSARSVAAFHEKPDASAAARLLGRGALWNTMIMAGRAQSFWSLAASLHPELVRRFEAVRNACSAGHERGVMRAVYRDMAAVSFSKEILQQAPGSVVALPLSGVQWCDWGRPERVIETLERLGREPSFPRDYSSGSSSGLGSRPSRLSFFK